MIARSVFKARFAALWLAGILAGAAPAHAATLVLDDFESPAAPAFGIPVGSGAQFFDRTFGSFAGLSGQVREANYNLYHDPASGGATARVGGGFAAVHASDAALGEFVFSYGAFTRPTGDPSIAGPFMGLDLRSFDTFRLDFSDVKYGLNINVVLYTSAPHLMPDSTPLYYLQSGINIAPASEGSAMVADLYLDARNPIASPFAPYFNFSQVDGIFLVIDRSGFSEGNKYLLETLEFTQSVPEPSTYLLMLLGLALAGARARLGRVVRRSSPNRLGAAALMIAGTAAAQAAAVPSTVSATPGSDYSTPVVMTASDGATMAGMRVTVSFADATTSTGTWATTGITSGRAFGDGWSLALGGGSINQPWSLSNTGGRGAIVGFAIDAAPGNTSFDIVFGDERTPDSVTGFPFGNVSVDPAGVTGAHAVYSNRLFVGGSFYGDMYELLSVRLDGGLQADGLLEFFADTDSAQAGSIRPSVPEPETYALMLGGLGGVAWVARRRRA